MEMYRGKKEGISNIFMTRRSRQKIWEVSLVCLLFGYATRGYLYDRIFAYAGQAPGCHGEPVEPRPEHNPSTELDLSLSKISGQALQTPSPRRRGWAFSNSLYYLGGMMRATPSNTTVPSWFVQVVFSLTRFFSVFFSITSTRAVMVSPIRTGAMKLSSCLR